jgi:hypothetical protein
MCPCVASEKQKPKHWSEPYFVTLLYFENIVTATSSSLHYLKAFAFLKIWEQSKQREVDMVFERSQYVD